VFSKKNKWLLVATTLGVLNGVALLIFAADVFNHEQNIAQTFYDLLLHLIPTAVVLFIVVVAYNRPLIGAIVFLVLGLMYIITGWASMHWTSHVLIAGPLLLLSALYITYWKSNE
jgi:uncharacterized membrane protein HdeD (DUF308 family)